MSITKTKIYFGEKHLYALIFVFQQTLSYNPQADFEPKGVRDNAKLMPVPFRKGVPQYESGR